MSRPIPVPQQFYNNGVVVAGGKLYSFAAGTTTPLATFTDESGGTPNANPTILDSQGKASIWIPQTTGYKFQLQDSLGNILWTIDQVFLIEGASINATQIAAGAIGTSKLAANPISTAKIGLAAITTALLAAGCVTTSKLAVGSVTINKLQSNIDLTTLTNMTDAPPVRGDSNLWLNPQYPWSTPSILTAPLTLPTGIPARAKWSPDGHFLAVAHATSPFVTIYERTGDTLTKLANPATLPTGTGTSVSWNTDGTLLAVGHSTTPWVTIYQRTGNVFTKITNPGVLPGQNVTDIAFSPNGELLLMAQSGGYTVYTVSGTTFSNTTTNLGSLYPTTFSTSICWSADGQYVALPPRVTPDFVQIAFRIGTQFYKLSQGNVLLGVTSKSCAWSPDNQYLAVATAGVTNGLLVLKLSGAPLINYGAGTVSGVTATHLTIPAVNQANDVAWSPDGMFLAVASSNSPFLIVFQRSGDTFTKLANVGTLPVSAAGAVGFSPTSKYLSVGGGGTAYINTYKTSGVIAAPGTVYGRNFINV